MDKHFGFIGNYSGGKSFAALAVLCSMTIALGSEACCETFEPVLKVAAGFAVERVYEVPRESQGSWISLCADRRGVLYASDQYGPVQRIELPARPGGEVTVRPVKLPIGGVHGLTWVGDELYAVVGQRDVCETGLYRVRDVDGDGELDAVEKLQALGGEGEHGPHAVAATADGKSLFVIAGNGTPLPKLTRSRVPEMWRNDSLLPPLPALIGSETRGLAHGGWICRTDREGGEWELVAMGMRNAYGVACDRAGEVFTFDSDTEFDIGLPWYRPTRVLHCVSGADFGWRGGALKVPEGAPDTVPPLLTLGLGSPTAVLFATGAAFPARYQQALFVADWSFGRLYAVHLQPAGAGFSAQGEEIVTGSPLPITAACVNPRDGAMYFAVGGRKAQSALYRLSWRGGDRGAETLQAGATAEAAGQRRALEAFHGRADKRAVVQAWPHLGSEDAILRHAARIAVESQPAESWRERALTEREPRAELAALLALAREGDARLQPRLWAALEALKWERLGGLRSEWLRVSAIAFCRGGGAPPEVRKRWVAMLGPQFPNEDRALNGPLCEMLVYLGDVEIAAKTLAQINAGIAREQQLFYGRCLSELQVGWTGELRGEFFEWLGRAFGWRGGASFRPVLERMRKDALAHVPEEQRAELERRFTAARPTAGAPAFQLPEGRGLVKEWKLDELIALLEEAKAAGDVERGRKWFVAVRCAACHTFAGEGGAVGADLTAVSRRMSKRDLVEAIVNPSKEISDQYGTIVLKRRDGSQLTGRIVNFNGGTVHVAENLFDPAAVTKVPEDEIEAIMPSKVSLMPSGLLNVLEAVEIIDLVAYLKSGAGP